MTLHLLLLLQAADTASTRDFALYVADAAGIGAFTFAWRTNSRMTRIETILTERRAGVIDRMDCAEADVQRHGQELQGHEVRLDGHDRELARLNRDDDRRRTLGPRDVGTPDRRST